MATTEEMNIELARYENRLFAGRYKIDDYLGTPNVTPNMSYNTSWDWLMPVWDRLRMDITGPLLHTGIQISQALKDCCITTAHRLIYEAITWLNQNKGK